MTSQAQLPNSNDNPFERKIIKHSGWPAKTFAGRASQSKLSRWAFDWLLVLAMAYLGGSWILSFMGVANAAVDPFQLGKTGEPAIASFNDAVRVSQTQQAQPAPTFYLSNGGSTMNKPTNTPTSQAVIIPENTATPVYTPDPNYTPQPTSGNASDNVSNFFAAGYSYYFPPFGPPNCSEANWDGSTCAAVLASGIRWRDYLGVGVAVPVQWRADMPLYTKLKIYTPDKIAGVYTVIDYCGGCIKGDYVYIDFLDNVQRLQWTTPLLIEVLR